VHVRYQVKLVPFIPMFREKNVRKGFLRDEQYDKLSGEAAREGLWLRAMLAVAYNFGWRKGELLGLRVHQVYLLARTIRLEVGETKNNSGRLVKMPDEVFTLISALVTGKKGDDHVFTRDDGKPVKNFRKIWTAICKRAEVPELLFHDLRRTGARNLRRLGIAESVAMKITGHRTPSIFKRYDITDESDLIEVANRLDQKRQLTENKSHEPEFEQSSSRKRPICTDSATNSNIAATRKPSGAVLPN
jgi:integrase